MIIVDYSRKSTQSNQCKKTDGKPRIISRHYAFKCWSLKPVYKYDSLCMYIDKYNYIMLIVEVGGIENYVNMIVHTYIKTVVFMIMNTIMIVGLCTYICIDKYHD